MITFGALFFKHRYTVKIRKKGLNSLRGQLFSDYSGICGKGEESRFTATTFVFLARTTRTWIIPTDIHCIDVWPIYISSRIVR